MAMGRDAQTRLNGHARVQHQQRPETGLSTELAERLRRVRAVAFDLDSTLVDFIRWKRRACEAAVRALIDAGLDLSTTGQREAHVREDDLVERLMDTYFRTNVESDTAITEFLELVGEGADTTLVSAAVSGYRRGKEAALEPYPRTVPTLVDLCKQGFQLAVVTDAPKPKATYRLAATGLVHFFDTVITSCDIEGGKSTAAPFEAVCSTLGREPDEVLMVGDWPERDIRIPKQMGMPTALAYYGMQSVGVTIKESDQADIVLHRIDDVSRVFRAVHGVGRRPY